jgi:hypothetical protein
MLDAPMRRIIGPHISWAGGGSSIQNLASSIELMGGHTINIASP